MKPALYGTENLKQSHGNKGPKRQARARKGMNQKQPLKGSGRMGPQGRSEPSFSREMLYCLPKPPEPSLLPSHSWFTLCSMWVEKFLRLFLNLLGSSKREPVSGNSVIRREISLNRPSWIRAASRKGTKQLNTKRRSLSCHRLCVGRDASPAKM